MSWEVVAHFDNAVAAELAKNMLEAEGIAVTRMDDESMATPWSSNSLQGGLKLYVRTQDLGRAELLLDRKPKLETDEEIAESVAARPEVAAQLSQSPEPFDEESPADHLAGRAFLTTVIGLLFLPARYFNPTESIIALDVPALSLLCIPLQLYSLYLLVQLRRSKLRVGPKNWWKVWLSLFLNVPLWLIVVVPLSLIVNGLQDPTNANWKNMRFTGMDGHALHIDFAEHYGHKVQNDVASALGPLTVRSFWTNHNGRSFEIDIETLPMELRPDDAGKALKDYVDRMFKDVRPESRKDVKLGVFPATELAIVYAAPKTGEPRFQRYVVALADRHVIVLLADVPDDRRDGKDVRRFFRTATLE